MIVLGIETSCDETAAAVVNGDGVIIAETILSQLDDHRPYGGVVPEVAARAHLEHVDVLVSKTMAKARIGFHELDAVAATGGPGLIRRALPQLSLSRQRREPARKSVAHLSSRTRLPIKRRSYFTPSFYRAS